MIRHLDTFSGLGAFALAAEWTGAIETVGFCEIDERCRLMLKERFPGVPVVRDIHTLADAAPDLRGTIDLITGGPPCQPASVAGKRQGSADERWLWPAFLRLVRGVRPLWVLAENPTGLLSLQPHGLDWVLGELEDAGYECQTFVIGSDDVGGSHRRKRLWIVGRLADSLRERRQQIAGGSPCDEEAHGREGWDEREPDRHNEPASQGQVVAVADGVRHGRRGRCDGDAARNGGEVQTPRPCSCGMEDADSSERRSPAEGRHDRNGHDPGREADMAFATSTRGRKFRRSQPGADFQAGREVNNGRSTLRAAGIDATGSSVDGAPGAGRRVYSSPVSGGEAQHGGGRVCTGMGPTLAGLDRAVDAPASRMDRTLASCSKHVARPGEEQKDWEAPRTGTGIPERAARLKAIGNAVDPLVAYQLLRGIVEFSRARDSY